MSSPFIINKTKFVYSSSKKFETYVDYIDREEAKRDKVGLYNSETQELDEELIREATCNAMNCLLEEEKLKDSAIWTASIHYNTDNIHVHIAMCEPYPTKERGKRKPKTLDKMKSKFTNTLLDYDKNYKKINEVIRDNIIGHKKDIKQTKKTLNNDVQLKLLYKKAIKNLPKDKKQWAYDYNTMKSRVYLDKITEHYLKNYKKEEYEELMKLLDEQQENLLYTYGEGKNNYYKNYKENKIKDLYKRMGNSTIKEIKGLLYTNENIKRPKIKISNKDINKLKRVLGNEVNNYKNQR